MVSSVTTSSILMCGVVSCSIFGRVVAAYAGEGSGGSGVILELGFCPEQILPQKFRDPLLGFCRGVCLPITLPCSHPLLQFNRCCHIPLLQFNSFGVHFPVGPLLYC